MSDAPDLLAIRRGSITAPAGCGKTQLIATTLLKQSQSKPILILTHTVAGVAALRARLDKLGVSPKSYRIATIDGWAIRLVSMFPSRSGINSDVLRIARPNSDYEAIRKAAVSMVKDGHLDDVLKASFSRQIVDEYQDCNMTQHALVHYSTKALPTCVLGDPMQAVFNFGGDLPDWDSHVCKYFPPAGELKEPWRWINAGTEPFGRWLLEVRRALASGRAVDLLTAPENVEWVHLDGTADRQRQLQAARTRPPEQGKVLIIGDSTSPPSQRLFASQTPGAVTVESVDLKDFIQFASRFRLDADNALEQLVGFADEVLTGVGSTAFLGRIAALKAGRARNPATDAELAGLKFEADREFHSAVELLVEINRQAGVRPHRPLVFNACIRAMNEADSANPSSLCEAAMRAREQNRQLGRSLPSRGVGSTLTLKGLEADVAVILDASPMDAAHLYVSMTRGSKKLIICSASSTLQPVKR
jgi:DNA helicase-2/ATP-dependent DNA helicase PcrA